ncbi:NAD(P)H-hydrate dehydratase [Paucibacter sp. APW11]|uniref:Bifunctional NAD(P)H-hydrate repair enzyme n=1 Tax=Roseateles aquae TaxID=3077235 RepID=A0ABU3P8G8_9BURK|nr:NAD(P)H-hydrate dehydratase [Paucibacter sp. APW11]MDT8998505.1 NAD(P)H-hydrate dehydratase [Paucibacter sp. APW11]
MHKVLPVTQRQPLLNVAHSRQLEAQAAAALPAHTLMARAGLAVAKLAHALAAPEACIWIVCGPGNNGGDGLIAARWLHQAGRRLRVQCLADLSRLPADAAWAAAAAHAAGVTLERSLELDCAAGDLLIDALLGMGLSRPAEGLLAAAITAVNRSAATVLAVDLPSGLQADTGQALGEALRADHSLSLLSLKPGLFTAQGRALCGTLWHDDLGVVSPIEADAWLSGAQTLQAWQTRHRRTADSHKGSFGDVLVVGGAPGMAGALQLAAGAALSAGAGRVYACGLDDGANVGVIRCGRAELMHCPPERLAQPESQSQATVVAGCGGGAAITPLLPNLLRHAARLVLDADGLNAVAASTDLQALLRQRASAGQSSILTPHPLEAARLLGISTSEVQADRLHSAQLLAEGFAATVILKGSGSVIASPSTTPSINSSGSAALATPGSGDVLAGWLGGMWAQAEEQPTQELAAAACYWHGLAADGWAGPLRASDLIEQMAAHHGR